MTNRQKIIELIRRDAAAIRAKGVSAVYLYGSVARGEASEDSDIDIFVEYDPSAKFSLIDLIGVQHIVEDATGRATDVTTENALHPMMRTKIMAEAVHVF